MRLAALPSPHVTCETGRLSSAGLIRQVSIFLRAFAANAADASSPTCYTGGPSPTRSPHVAPLLPLFHADSFVIGGVRELVTHSCDKRRLTILSEALPPARAACQ